LPPRAGDLMARPRRGRGGGGPGPAPADPGRAHWRADGGEKRRFDSAESANRATLQHRLEDGADLEPYPCPVCGGWHLASAAR